MPGSKEEIISAAAHLLKEFKKSMFLSMFGREIAYYLNGKKTHLLHERTVPMTNYWSSIVNIIVNIFQHNRGR
jgi:hypothetical protein